MYYCTMKLALHHCHQVPDHKNIGMTGVIIQFDKVIEFLFV